MVSVCKNEMFMKQTVLNPDTVSLQWSLMTGENMAFMAFIELKSCVLYASDIWIFISKSYISWQLCSDF